MDVKPAGRLRAVLWRGDFHPSGRGDRESSSESVRLRISGSHLTKGRSGSAFQCERRTGAGKVRCASALHGEGAVRGLRRCFFHSVSKLSVGDTYGSYRMERDRNKIR